MRRGQSGKVSGVGLSQIEEGYSFHARDSRLKSLVRLQ